MPGIELAAVILTFAFVSVGVAVVRGTDALLGNVTVYEEGLVQLKSLIVSPSSFKSIKVVLDDAYPSAF